MVASKTLTSQDDSFLAKKNVFEMICYARTHLNNQRFEKFNIWP
jgi:hypothetical protein